MSAYRFRQNCQLTWILAAPVSFLFIFISVLTEIKELAWIGFTLALVFLVAIITHFIMWVEGIGERPDNWTVDDIIKDKLIKGGVSEEEAERYVRIRNAQTNTQVSSRL